MRRFLESIQIYDGERFSLSFYGDKPFRKENGIWIYEILKETPWEYDLLHEFQEHLMSITEYKLHINFHYKKTPTPNDALALLYEWYSSLYHLPLESLDTSFSDNIITITYGSNLEKEKMNQVLNDFRDFLAFISYPIKVDEIVNEKVDINYEQEHLDYVHEVVPELKKREEEQRRLARAFLKGNYIDTKIHFIYRNFGNVSISGTVFHLDDEKTTRDGKRIVTFYMNDETYSIPVKIIENRVLNDEKISQIKLKQKVKVRGAVQVDKFSNQLIVLAHYIDFLEPDPWREDNEEEKRVELHLHTKMSTMDAVTTITDYCALAAHFGHKAIG